MINKFLVCFVSEAKFCVFTDKAFSSPDHRASAPSSNTDTNCTLFDLSFPQCFLHVEKSDLSSTQQYEDINERHTIDFL